MLENKLMTREDLRKKYPEYDNLRAIDKLMLDLEENTYSGNFIRNTGRGAEFVPVVLGPIFTYFNFEDPGIVRYMASAAIGLTIGLTLRVAISELMYETFSEEGDVGKHLNKWEPFVKLKDYLTQDLRKKK